MTGSPALAPATGRVHWIGTGMSTGSGLGLVCGGADTAIQVIEVTPGIGSCMVGTFG